MDTPDLRTLLELQRAAFARGAPDYARRIAALKALRDALHARETELVQAVAADFGGRAHEETLLLELFVLHDQIRHAIAHLKRWMRRQPVRSSWFLLPSSAFIEFQPLGVVGIVGAWNYQLLLSLGPMVDAIAAGNHVLLKPSEIAPRSADAIARLLADVFPADYIHCVTGGPELAQAFSALPFDHLFFTGSTEVGRRVMQAAAANLTPVTLELGGKSPAIIHPSYPLRRATARILTGKLLNAGQTCVAPDYLLLPAGSERAFEDCARRHAASLYADFAGNADYTRIVSRRHYERLLALLRDAQARGARAVFLGGPPQPDADELAFPPVLLFDVDDSMAVMQEEIFGPLLPVKVYEHLDEALAFVNSRPRPLALYYFDDDRRRQDFVLRNTMSGGVTLNDCLLHLGQHGLPFGGVGASGIGHYHGHHGFLTFSKQRGVMLQSRWTGTALLRAPWKSRHRLLRLLLSIAGRR